MQTDNELTPRIGPLHQQHLDLGAKLVDFAGWLMPIEYDGVVKEHQRVRQSIGIFDVSHMGTVLLLGDGAVALADATFALDVAAVPAGKAAYGLCLNESGGVIDDLLIYVRSSSEVMVIPNASNVELVVAALAENLSARTDLGSVAIHDVSTEYAIIAAQGPESGQVLAKLNLRTDLDYMSFYDVAGFGESDLTLTVARSGYTGEYGFELIVPVAGAAEVWGALAQAAAEVGGGPAGLGARDTLRLEMGYPLHGHELTPDRIALAAPISWTVGWDKAEFVGKSALVAAKESQPSRKLVGLKFLDRGIPRDEMAVLSGVGDQFSEVGIVTSGTFSPSLKVGVALALVDTQVLDSGAELVVDVRGRHCAVERVTLPFVDSNPRVAPA